MKAKMIRYYSIRMRKITGRRLLKRGSWKVLFSTAILKEVKDLWNSCEQREP
jgi:hypothetical protein